MGIARNAATVQVRRGALLCLVATIAGASGCGSMAPGTAAAPGQQPVVRRHPAAPPPPGVRPGEVTPPRPEAEPGRAAKEQTGTGVAVQGTQARGSWLEQGSESFLAHLHGSLRACHAAQAQVAARQEAAARLQARRDDLQRQQARAAALREAQAGVLVPSQAVPPAPLPAAPFSEPSAPAAVPVEAAVVAPARVMSPPMGVVRDVRPFRGRPYATLSIGYDAGLRRGMRLGLADPRTGAPTGVVIIDEAGPAEAGGVVEGTDPLGLRAGLTVHAIAGHAP